MCAEVNRRGFSAKVFVALVLLTACALLAIVGGRRSVEESSREARLSHAVSPQGAAAGLDRRDSFEQAGKVSMQIGASGLYGVELGRVSPESRTFVRSDEDGILWAASTWSDPPIGSLNVVPVVRGVGNAVLWMGQPPAMAYFVPSGSEGCVAYRFLQATGGNLRYKRKGAALPPFRLRVSVPAPVLAPLRGIALDATARPWASSGILWDPAGGTLRFPATVPSEVVGSRGILLGVPAPSVVTSGPSRPCSLRLAPATGFPSESTTRPVSVRPEADDN